MGDQDCIIRVRGLEKSFGDNAVLRGVDLDIQPGAVTAIIGKSGEGKSVLLKCISGLLKPDKGSIEIGCKQDSVIGGPRLSYLFQNNALFDSMTALDNVALPLREHSVMKEREIRDKVRQLFDRLDLGDIGGRYPAELSGGMQKRVALARALVLDPEVVLFDEPTSGLDPLRKNAVFLMIARYQREFGFTAVVVSHDLPDVLFISDYVLTLRGGRIAFKGSPLQLDQSESRFNDGFLHSRDELRMELSGLNHAKEMDEKLPALREDGVRFAVIVMREHEVIEDILGTVAVHLIETAIIRYLKEADGFGDAAYALGRGVIAMTVDSNAATSVKRLRRSADRLREYLLNLHSARCAEFKVDMAFIEPDVVIDCEDLKRQAVENAEPFFRHTCQPQVVEMAQ